MQLENEGMAYLDEKEDFRGYSEKSGIDFDKKPDTVDKIGSFFRKQSMSIKQKYEETDFKGGASDLGKSITSVSKKTGSKISKSFKDINNQESVHKMKKSIFGWATKVKGLFKSKEEIAAEEAKKA